MEQPEHKRPEHADADPTAKPGFGHWLAQFSIERPVTVVMVFASFMVLGAVSIVASGGSEPSASSMMDAATPRANSSDLSRLAP